VNHRPRSVGFQAEQGVHRSAPGSQGASSQAVRFFDAIAGRYDRSYALQSTESRRRMAWALAVMPPPPARVLDLGVGTGREIPFLLDGGHRVTGLDVSSAMLERCARRSRPIPLVNADFWQSLPFEDESFDAVLALHGTLAHAPDDVALGRLGIELARVTVAGAVWVIEVPSPAWLEGFEHSGGVEGCAVRRTGPRTCVYEDFAASVSIDVRLPSADQWRALLEPLWDVKIEAAAPYASSANPTGSDEEPRFTVEWRIVARRR